jgi:hypothetical protein
MAESELIEVMQNSVYPGAALPSIKLALGYCKSQGLDPDDQARPHRPHAREGEDRKKPNGKIKTIYEKRDVIMPGIDSTAPRPRAPANTSACSEPEFGPDGEELGGKEKNGRTTRPAAYVKGVASARDEGEVEYPEWCRVTVKRLVDGSHREFTAIEYWKENYATAGNYTDAPNKMWRKRPRGQLAKCTEAQALRRAFPERSARSRRPRKWKARRSMIRRHRQRRRHGRRPRPRAAIEERRQGRAKPARARPSRASPRASRNRRRRCGDEKKAPGPADKPMIENQIKILRAPARAALTSAMRTSARTSACRRSTS